MSDGSQQDPINVFMSHALEKKRANSSPDNKILDWFKLKAFANKLNVAKMMISPCYGVENIVGKEENAGNQHFLFFPQCFQKASSIHMVIKSRDCLVKD